MPDAPEKFYLTTPIYYVNARPHIGHAYTTVVADVIARRHRLLGHDTFFLTGTDEHGQKIERSAAAAGVPPQQFADGVSSSFRDLWKRMGITNDAFIRTTDPHHKQGVQHLFQLLKDRGHIYLSTYTGQYCVSDEAYVDGPPGIRCPDCGRVTETVSESNYYFRLSAFQLPLLDLIESNQLRITPDSRRNEVLSFLRGSIYPFENLFKSEEGELAELITESDMIEHCLAIGALKRTSRGELYVPGTLKDLSISRTSFKWGIPVPGDEAHVIYVWLDALANYMTAVGYGSNTPEDIAKFEKYWPADLHLVGKEIIRFHCVYWPAFLLAAGLPTPKAITAHGWLLFDNSKMSKSKGNIVRTETILDTFGALCPAKPSEPSSSAEGPASLTDPTPHQRDLFATDVLRYFLLREIPFGQDGSFSFDSLVTRYNADLANGYGNLVSRTLKLVQQNLPDGWIIPKEPWFYPEANDALTSDKEALSTSYSVSDLAVDRIEINDEVWWPKNQFHSLLSETMSTVSHVDSYLSAHKPWVLAKSTDEQDRQRLIEILYTAAESIRILTALLYPILPFATAKVWAQLGLGSIEQAADNGELKTLTWGGLQPGTKLGPLSPIFPRADKGLAQTMADIEQNNANPTGASAEADAQTSTSTEFPESPLASVAQGTPLAPEATDGPYPGVPAAPPQPSRLTNETVAATPATPSSSTAPDAGPRTGSLTEPDPIAQVAGSASPTPVLHKPPSHTEAQPSGPFASPGSARPIAQSSAGEPTAPQITIDDFAKVELRVARILVCERIPKADKLLRLEVDLGPDLGRRQILSGIAEWYTPEDLIGRKIVVITNLAPRKMRGLDSHGMLLAASTGDNGKPALATFADSDNIEPGARLK